MRVVGIGGECVHCAARCGSDSDTQFVAGNAITGRDRAVKGHQPHAFPLREGDSLGLPRPSTLETSAATRGHGVNRLPELDPAVAGLVVLVD